MAVSVKKLDSTNNAISAFIKNDGKAAYASRPSESRGRIYEEKPSETRTDFQRDRDRVIHSRAFRRLKHKTQVFVYSEGDHYRTRLSHSIEVAQVARSLARSFYADEDLAEICALAHDLGHTPFAHEGEVALKECMAEYGGFDHNDQTLRVVTLLENRYPNFDGINLTWESLEGLVKHNGPVIEEGKENKLEATLSWLSQKTDLMLDSYASIEAQIAGISDDIAYNSHDLDDGLAAGYFILEELEHIPLIAKIINDTRCNYPNATISRFNAQVVREIMGAMVADVRAGTQKRLLEIKPETANDIRNAGVSVVAFSDEMQKTDKMLREFLWNRFYQHNHVARQRFRVFKVIKELFKAFCDYEKALPYDWQDRIYNMPADMSMSEENWRVRVIADYIANMTDRYAILTHRELFDPYEQL